MPRRRGTSPVAPSASARHSSGPTRSSGRLVAPTLTPTSDGTEDPRAMLVDVAHDELHDPGDVAARVALGKSDPVELLVRERPHEGAEVLRGHFEEAQRLVSRWQAEPSAPTPVELVGDLPVERERLLADKHLLDPAARADDALTNVVRDVSDRPALPTAGQSPLCGGQRL